MCHLGEIDPWSKYRARRLFGRSGSGNKTRIDGEPPSDRNLPSGTLVRLDTHHIWYIYIYSVLDIHVLFPTHHPTITDHPPGWGDSPRRPRKAWSLKEFPPGDLWWSNVFLYDGLRWSYYFLMISICSLCGFQMVQRFSYLECNHVILYLRVLQGVVSVVSWDS